MKSGVTVVVASLPSDNDYVKYSGNASFTVRYDQPATVSTSLIKMNAWDTRDVPAVQNLPADYTGKVNWKSSDESIAKIVNGKIVFGGMTICLCLYLLFPTGLQLRQPIERTNLCAQMVNALRSVDTPSNVCPSIHVSSTVGILLTLFRSKKLHDTWKIKIPAAVLGVLICVSTVMLDQHSIIDVILGIVLSTVLCGLAEQNQEEGAAARSAVNPTAG